MIKGVSRRELSVFGFVEDFGILGILRRKFLFHFFGSLSQGCGERKLPDMGVVLPQYSPKSSCIPLLSINSGGEFCIIQFHCVEIS